MQCLQFAKVRWTLQCSLSDSTCWLSVGARLAFSRIILTPSYGFLVVLSLLQYFVEKLMKFVTKVIRFTSDYTGPSVLVILMVTSYPKKLNAYIYACVEASLLAVTVLYMTQVSNRNARCCNCFQPFALCNKIWSLVKHGGFFSR